MTMTNRIQNCIKSISILQRSKKVLGSNSCPIMNLPCKNLKMNTSAEINAKIFWQMHPTFSTRNKDIAQITPIPHKTTNFKDNCGLDFYQIRNSALSFSFLVQFLTGPQKTYTELKTNAENRSCLCNTFQPYKWFEKKNVLCHFLLIF